MRFLVLLLSLGASATAFAQPSDDMVVLLGAESSYDRISSDDFAALRLRAAGHFRLPRLGCDERKEEDCTTTLTFLLQAPLQLRFRDGGRPDPGVLRQDAWDEPEEISRALPTLRYGDARGPVSLELGQLGPSTLRHGTLLQDYFNVLTPDHHKPGARLDILTPGVAASALVDNVLAPELLAGSIATHPGVWLGWSGLAAQWSVGATLAMDLAAPTAVASGGEDARRPEVLESAPTSALGVDLDAWLYMSDAFDVGLFADLNHHLDVGDGAHLGARLQARFSDVVSLGLEGDAVWFRGGYIPRYFGPIYEVERFGFAGFGAPLPAPKRRIAATPRGASVGWSAALHLAVTPWNLTLDARVADHDLEDDGSVLVSLRANPWEPLHLAAFYHRASMDSWGDALSLEGSLVSAEARVDLADWAYVMGRLDQTWALEGSGAYAPTRNLSLGVGVHGAWAL